MGIVNSPDYFYDYFVLRIALDPVLCSRALLLCIYHWGDRPFFRPLDALCCCCFFSMWYLALISQNMLQSLSRSHTHTHGRHRHRHGLGHTTHTALLSLTHARTLAHAHWNSSSNLIWFDLNKSVMLISESLSLAALSLDCVCVCVLRVCVRVLEFLVFPCFFLCFSSHSLIRRRVCWLVYRKPLTSLGLTLSSY